MKSAMVICRDTVDPVAVLAAVAHKRGYSVAVAPGYAQITNLVGRLFTVMAGESDYEQWDEEDRNLLVASVEAPNRLFRGFAVECRWERLFCELVSDFGAAVEDVWVVDSDGVVWSWDDLDPERIVL
ncbi:MAG: hypothetical protein R2733_19925 [Acidimicrobiales bacterium]